MRDNDHAARWLRFLPALALSGAAICFAWMTRAQSPTQVQIALALCALSLTFGPALLIERTRAQRRMRTM